MSRHLPFRILVTAVFIILVVPQLLQDGMFTDGLLYTCISKNLSEGLGTFWYPHFSATMFPEFHQQPPLMFGIQAGFFWLFGKSIYVERFYSLLTGLVSFILIIMLWRELFKGEEERKIEWLPVLLWIIIPVCFWSYANNMEENTMTVFVLLSVLFVLKGLAGSDKAGLNFFLAGIFLFLSSLTKGFPGLFPLTAVFFYWLFSKRISFVKMLLYTAILLIVPLVLYFLLLQDPNIQESLRRYLFNRVINSISHVSTQSSRLYILGKLFLELLLPMVLTGILAILVKTKQGLRYSEKQKSLFFLFLLLGIAGSFPLTVTREQRGFYLVTSLPFYAIALALLTAGGIHQMVSLINIRCRAFIYFRYFSVFLLILSLCLSLLSIGRTKRDHEMLHDVYLLGKSLPKGSIISVPFNLFEDWSLQQYFMRHYTISLDPFRSRRYFLVEKSSDAPAGYAKLGFQTRSYDLCERTR
jgi:4-amino-4-deoxy-L-arabinose transferase-like glycosyltransferase